MSKLIVVVGLTGTQGGSVANVFLKEAGWKVRGITRNASKATDWKSKGVEVVQADLDDKNSLIAAFKGATAIFGTTDFWGPVFNPANKSKLKEGQAINEWAFHYEQQQAKNIAEAAAVTEGLDRFITSSLCNAKYWTKGKYSHVYHFDSKALVVEYIKEKLPKLAAIMSVLQVGAYMTNWKMGAVPKKQADGTFHYASVGKGDRLIPFCNTGVDTGYFVRALLQVAPGKNLLGEGSMLSWKEYAKIWCDVNKVPYGGYDEVPFDAFIQGSGMGPDLGLEFTEMYALMDEFGYDGGDPSIVHPKDLGVPCPTTSWEQFCKEEDFSTVL